MNLAFLYDCRAIGWNPLPVPSSPSRVESRDNSAALVETHGQAAREPFLGVSERKDLLPSIMAAAGGIPQSDAAPASNQTLSGLGKRCDADPKNRKHRD